MISSSSYPHVQYAVVDGSIYDIVEQQILPLFRPIFFMVTQEGKPGVPVFKNTVDAFKRVFGAETFNELNKTYFGNESAFIKGIMQDCGAFIVRMVPEDANTATMALFVTTELKEIPQWERDVSGAIIMEGGNPKPLLDVDDSHITMPGYSLTYSMRALAADETITGLSPVTIDEPTEKVTYPVWAGQVAGPGVYGNDCGLEFYCDANDNDRSTVTRTKSVVYRVAPVRKVYGQTSVNPILDRYDNLSVRVSPVEGLVDPATNLSLGYDDVMYTNYPEASHPVPFSGHMYEDTFKTIGTKVIAKEGAAYLTEGPMVDIVSAKDTSGNPYKTLIITPEGDSPLLKKSINHYFVGGTDGDIGVTSKANMIKTYLSGTANPDIKDEARYPFNHLYDVGYPLEVKKSMMAFQNIREDVKTIISPQDVSLAANDMATDMASGSSLRTEALLSREDVVKGTAACRTTIVGQCGYLANSTYKGLVPLTYAHARLYAKFHNSETIKDSIYGKVNANVPWFKDLNYLPNCRDQKRMLWDAGINYVEHYDMSGLFFAGLHSVYPSMSSVLSDDSFTAVEVYTKQIVRFTWPEFASSDEAFGDYKDSVTTRLDDNFRTAFGDRVQITPNVHQTEIEQLVGYAARVDLSMAVGKNKTQWYVGMLMNKL